MKENNIHSVGSFKFDKNHSYLFDANVWIFLFPPASKPAPREARPYSNALKEIVKCKAAMMLEPVILSEYINSYCRIEYYAWMKKNPKGYEAFTDQKKFRQSIHFESIGRAAVSESKDILELCSYKETPFKDISINSIFDVFEKGYTDFNDGLILEACRVNNWKMLSHDGDMKYGDVDIITNHRGLLGNNGAPARPPLREVLRIDQTPD